MSKFVNEIAFRLQQMDENWLDDKVARTPPSKEAMDAEWKKYYGSEQHKKDQAAGRKSEKALRRAFLRGSKKRKTDFVPYD